MRCATMRALRCGLAAMLCGLLPPTGCRAAPPRNAIFYVAPDGNDTNAGSKQKPFKTLEKARDAARRVLGAQKADVLVDLRGGEYFLDAPLAFSSLDSGRNGHNVIYQSAPGETATLIGGRRITGWQSVDGKIYRAPTDPRWKFNQLFESGKRQILARFPNAGYLEVAQGVGNSNTQFIFGQNDVPDWKDWRGAQACIWAGYDWFSNTLDIKNVDRATHTMTLSTPALVPIVANPHRRYFLQGAREALDSPGEWWRDPDSGEVFFWPKSTPIGKQEIIAPTTNRIIAVRGDSPDDPVQSIVFRNLHFSISNFGDEFVERRGTHGSTPWNEPANKDAAVYLENAHDCVVENCEVSDAGYSGIGIVWGGENNRIINNEIHDCGFHGVLLSGYRAEFGSTMDCNKENQIIGNTIHDCGKLVGHGGGIFIWASGENDVERNRISHMPRYGICIKGQNADTIGEMSTHQWGGVYPQKVGDEVHGLETMTAENRYQFIHSNGNRIAFNDIAFCNEDTEDSGFVSLWGTGKNNVIENNVIHDGKRALGGIMIGIYLDDAVNDTRVDKNVIYGLQGGDVVYPIFAKGVFNVIEDNIVICEDKPGAAIASLAMGGEPTDHHSYRRNIIYLKGQSRVYDFMNWSQDRVIESDFNCFFPPRGEYSFAGAPGDWTKLDGGKFDSHSIFSDPLFMDLDKRDFRLKPDSPALKLGFEQPAPLNAP